MNLCCDDGPADHSRQEHHDASPCYDEACGLNHPYGGPFPHPCGVEGSTPAAASADLEVACPGDDGMT